MKNETNNVCAARPAPQARFAQGYADAYSARGLGYGECRDAFDRFYAAGWEAAEGEILGGARGRGNAGAAWVAGAERAARGAGC